VNRLRQIAVSLIIAGLGLVAAVGISNAAVSRTFTYFCSPGVLSYDPLGSSYTQVEIDDNTAYPLTPEVCEFTGRIFGGWAASAGDAESQIVKYANGQSVKFKSIRASTRFGLGSLP